jgi:septal ring-binding cell division protein DamX
MRILKHSIVMLLITSLTGCGFISGLFNKNDVDDDVSNLLNEPTAKKQWFCYGSQVGKAWECENAPDESKISPIKPKAKAAKTNPSNSIQSVAERSTLILADNQDNLGNIAPTTPATTTTTTTTTTAASNSIQDNVAAESNSTMQTATKTATAASKQTNTAPATPLTIVENKAQLLDAPRNFYAVQLLALKRESDLLEYARINGIPEPLYMPIASGGTNWYVLLLGVYADKQSAETAMANWEKTKTLKIRPWIRQLGQLQDAMRAAQEG